MSDGTTAPITLSGDAATLGSDLIIHQVNTQGLRNTCLNSTSSGSFQISPLLGYARITPHKAGSKIFIQIICPCGGTDDETGYNPYYHGFMKRSINGGSFSNADFLGQDNSQVWCKFAQNGCHFIR